MMTDSWSAVYTVTTSHLGLVALGPGDAPAPTMRLQRICVNPSDPGEIRQTGGIDSFLCVSRCDPLLSLTYIYIWSYSMHDESRILDMTPLRPQYRLNLILSQSRLNPCYFFHFFFCINEFIIEQEGRLPFANDFHGTGVVVLLGHLHYSWDLSWIELPLSHPAGPSGHLSRLSFFFFLLKLACVRIYSLLVCK